MNETKLATLEQIREFPAGTTEVVFAIPAEEHRLRAFVATVLRSAIPAEEHRLRAFVATVLRSGIRHDDG